MNQSTTFLMMLLLISGWTIIPFLKKIPLRKITPVSFLLFNHLAVHILLLLYVVFLLTNGKFTTTVADQFNNLGTKDLLFIIAVSIIGIASGLTWINLIKNHYVSYIIPHIQPLIIVLTVLVSYFFFSEPLNRYNLSGILLVLGGLFLINYGKKKSKTPG